jgi:hypothetical protein
MERLQAAYRRLPGSLHPSAQHILVDTQVRRNTAYRLFPFLGQCCRLGFEFLRVNTPFCTFLSRLSLSFCFIPRLFLWLQDGVRFILIGKEGRFFVSIWDKTVSCV